MKHHRLSLTALAVAILTAGHALALQTPSGEPASPRPHIAEMERFTASELMAELTRLAATTDGRVAFRDRDGLLERIQGRLDRLTTLADAQGGRWGTGFDIFLSTNDPAPRPCGDHTPVMIISRQGTELTGTACRLHTIQDGVPIVTLDQLLDAPFEGQTIHIHVVTNMAAERDSLLASGNEVLSAMATDILRALVLANPRSSGEDWLLWRDALQTLTDRADGFIHFNAPDTLAQAFAAAVTGILEATDVEETDWGFTFGVDGAQSFSDGGLFDTDRLATASRPETAAWCLPDVSFMATGPTGIDHTWHQCAGTPPDEDPDTLIVRKIWTEERSSRVYRWLELTLFGSTETPDELPSVDRLTRELLALMANDVIIAPRAPAGSGK